MQTNKRILKTAWSIVLFISINYLGIAQSPKKIQFVGAARSILGNNEINVKDVLPDTLTAKKNSGGYALIDLGFNITPNKNTEILGMIRIRNAFGGFWGSGVTFDVRQLYLKGIIGDIIRYQVGDINYKLTPYTFYNNDEETMITEPGVFKMQKDIVNYETFYQKNTWRQQGAAIDFALQFAKIIKEIKFNGFLTRMNATDFATTPERFYGGGNIGIQQSNNLFVGFNYVNLFDLLGTAPNNTNGYRNYVGSVNFELKKENEKYYAGILGETGISKAYYTSDTLDPSLGDSFLDVAIAFKYKPIHTKIKIGYMDVGPDFRSAGAQSKRLNYNGLTTTSLYQRYGNDQNARPLGMLDMMQDASLYNKSISNNLMAYSPIYNNVLPYGNATFNRSGIYVKLDFADKKEILNVTADAYFLNEIRGQGTSLLKSYGLYKANMVFNVDKLIKWKNSLKITSGVALQSTNRNKGENFNAISLNSTMWNVGIEIEVVKNLDVLGGIMAIDAKGNEFISTRNFYSEVVDLKENNFNTSEKIVGGGLRFRFNEKTYLSALAQNYSYEDKLKQNVNYEINQFMIIFNLKF